MRPQQNRRMRGRGNSNNNRKGPNPLTRSYESNGPDVKIRGTAQQVADKYTALARDAQSSGDRVIAENYLQHAEHYNRIIMTAQAQQQAAQQTREAREADEQDDRDDNFDNRANASSDSSSEAGKRESGSGDQPAIEGTPVEFAGRSEDEAPRSRGRRKPAKNGADDEANSTNGESVQQATSSDEETGTQDAAQKKPRRARRPRKDTASGDNGTGDSEGSKESLPEAAQ